MKYKLTKDEKVMELLTCIKQHNDGEELDGLRERICSDLKEGRQPRDYSNSLVPLNSTIEGENVYYWPNFNPRFSLPLNITGHEPIFANKCALVDADYKGNQFSFFDPTNNPKYKEGIGKTMQVKLAALGVTALFLETPQESLEDFFTAPVLKTLQSRGYCLDFNTNPPLYKAIFKVRAETRRVNGYMGLDVLNPFDNQLPMELLSFVDKKDGYPKETPKRVGSRFYFIGSLE